MAFITYILLTGVSYGFKDQYEWATIDRQQPPSLTRGPRRFTPELLGVTASSMCGWLVVEILCYYAAFYLLNLNSSAGAWELCALTAYKYVG